MDASSPIHAYVVGLGLHALGLHALLRPRQEYARLGLPLLESAQPQSHKHLQGTTDIPEESPDTAVSPLIYIKGVRDVTYGLALVGLQHQGDAGGVTTVAAAVALAALGDGLVLWLSTCRGAGRRRRRRVAVQHWVVGLLGLGSWAAWRAFRAYGEWAAFHALGY